MIRYSSLLLCAALIATLTIRLSEAGSKDVPVTYEVKVEHPNLQASGPSVRTLHMERTAQGGVGNYYLDVPSVICGDSVCEVITVRLYWDPLGNYLRYEFPEGGTLTKKGHERFTAADNAKLQSLLLDSNSSVKGIDPSLIVHPADVQSDNQVDGSSGATVLTDKTVIVSGAVYTCYTLWHWANNDIQQKMRGFTVAAISDEQLMEYLSSAKEGRVEFAVAQLTARSIYDDRTASMLFEIIKGGNAELIGLGLDYFEHMGAEAYFSTIEHLFASGSSSINILCLASLISTDLKAPAGFYERLCVQLPTLESYQEVHMLIRLLGTVDPVSPKIIDHTMQLLDNRSFLKARKAYYFLQEQDLSASQSETLAAFREKQAGRL